MPKSKHAPALFELISKAATEEGLRARGPQGAGLPPADLSAEPIQVVPEPVEARLPQADPDVVEPSMVEPLRPIRLVAPPDDGTEPLWQISGGHVRFSLNQRNATIALAVAGFLLLTAHFLGYRFGERRGRALATATMAVPSTGAQEIEDARRGPVTPKLFEGVGEDPMVAVPAAETAGKSPPSASVPRAATYEPARVGWVQGHTYIVVQDFGKGARADAEMAQTYLAQNGIQSAILERSGNYPFRLITAQGFDRDDHVQKKLAEEYQDRIRRLGQAYLQAGGRYVFKDAYFMKLTGDTW